MEMYLFIVYHKYKQIRPADLQREEAFVRNKFRNLSCYKKAAEIFL